MWARDRDCPVWDRGFWLQMRIQRHRPDGTRQLSARWLKQDSRNFSARACSRGRNPELGAGSRERHFPEMLSGRGPVSRGRGTGPGVWVWYQEQPTLTGTFFLRGHIEVYLKFAAKVCSFVELDSEGVCAFALSVLLPVSKGGSLGPGRPQGAEGNQVFPRLLLHFAPNAQE